MQPPDLSRTLFIDFETRVDEAAGLSLEDMTLAEYLARTEITASAWAMGDGDPVCQLGRPTQETRDLWARVAADPQWVVVAHNAPFDVRVLHRLAGVPYPQRARCSLELACAVLPSNPGGYSLAHLAECFDLPPKLGIDFATATPEELARYNCHDVWLCREIYRRVVPHLSEDELRVAEMCMAIRELRFAVDAGAVDAALASFMSAAGQSYALAQELFGADAAARIFNVTGEGEDAIVRSVRRLELRKVLAKDYRFDAGTTSLKKINPEMLRANNAAHRRLKAVGDADRYLSQSRRTTVFSGRTELDVELAYFRAHTGRFSSPQPGCKGANLHNIPKRNKVLAKAMRSILRLPEGLCWVRGDLANVEYRGQQLMLGNQHAARLFAANVWADPYLGFGKEATGLSYPKSHPIRQAFKESVLGLNYLMGLPRFVLVLLQAMANSQLDPDPSRHLSEAVIAGVCADRGWTRRRSAYFTRIRNETGAPECVLTLAYHLRERFHELHPESKAVAAWLEEAVKVAASFPDPAATLAEMARLPGAPDPKWLRLVYCPDLYGPGTRTLKLGCGLWDMPTVTWRDLAVREMPSGGQCLTMVSAGAKPPKPVSPNLLIENWVQSAMRNALCRGQLMLADLGYPYQLSVHDEILVAVPRDVDAVAKARDDLLAVFGAGGAVARSGWEWACVINPAEVSCSVSLYEDQQTTDWWQRVASRDPATLENLP